MNLDKNYLSLQIDEIETLHSIYDKELSVINEEERIFEIKLEFESYNSIIKFSLPNEYPDSPPICELGIPWIRGDEKSSIENSIQNVCLDNLGCPMVYQIVECIRDELAKLHKLSRKNCSTTVPKLIDTKTEIVENLFEVFHGEPFVDRKSTFQAHVARVKNEEEVEIVKQQLMANNKIAVATHNISAYRIRKVELNGNSKLFQSCDDDGENKASERLLNMLVLMGVENIYVVISRWFGGIKLGADRFKHINNTAKDAIVRCGWFQLKHAN